MANDFSSNDNELLANEIKIFQELMEKVNLCLGDLSRKDSVDSKEKDRFREEAYKLLESAQKSLLKRQIMMKINNLNRERVLLSALNEKHLELARLGSDFLSGRGRELTRKYDHAPATYGKPKTGSDLNEELKRIREQIYRTMTSETEEENKK